MLTPAEWMHTDQVHGDPNSGNDILVSVWVMQSKNKAGCETTSLELRRQRVPVDGLWEEDGKEV